MNYIEKKVNTQNEINNEDEDNMRPGTPRALLVEEYVEYYDDHQDNCDLLRDSDAASNK